MTGRSGQERNGGGRQFGGRRPRNVDDGVVRIAPRQARELAAHYRRAGGAIWDAGLAIDPLLREASDLLERHIAATPLAEVALLLGEDVDDLDWRIDFVEVTDGFDLRLRPIAAQMARTEWRGTRPADFTFEELAVLLAQSDDVDEVGDLLSWIVDGGGIDRYDRLANAASIPTEYRRVIAGSMLMVFENGWRPEGGVVPAWLSVGMVEYADPSDEMILMLASEALHDPISLFDAPRVPDPFGLSDGRGAFAYYADHLSEDHELGRRFIDSLLDEHERTGDTRLNMHGDENSNAVHLASLLVATGTTGDLAERTDFVNRVVTTLNADRDTNEPVFWATWAIHADLALSHGIATTQPTFSTHHLMPDFVRPTWEHAWHEHISPAVLESTFWVVKEIKENGRTAALMGVNPALAFLDRARGSENDSGAGPGNDAGGTYSTREKKDFHGTRFHYSDADRGRNVITHALEDSSDRGDIAQDEFAIIDHGIGANGKPTYTINLPGVIDLSSPMPGFDPVHQSVRDMDQAALKSATSAEVEDNLYAQMVVRALAVNDIPIGANLMLVGHSFGADTAADLAANSVFTDDYNVTHVVAAAYDSVPQLAHIDPSINVLVLQNEDDKAITLEATQRAAASTPESVSINTFAHEVREFDGGWGLDIGHHQDRYIDYLDNTNDTVMTEFYESVAATGYGDAGTSVAVDVTLDESLVSE